MRILLVQPPPPPFSNKEFLSLQFPLNLGYIAAALIREGHEVRFVDLNVQKRSLVLDHLREFDPDIFAVTAMTPMIYAAMNLIAQSKELKPSIITVLGGIHASALPESTLQSIDSLDVLVFGEGEATMVELAQALEHRELLDNLKGIVFRSSGNVVRNEARDLIEEIDTIPFPTRSLIPMELYQKAHVNRGFSRKDLRIVEIITTRGCPNDCIFCAGHLNYGQSVRFRSSENVKEEIEQCIAQFGITHVSIEDDTFTLNRRLVIELSEYFAERRLTWTCYARVNTVDFHLLRLMASSGCRKIAFGVESGSPEILRIIRKRITLEQVRNAVREAKKAGIRFVECDFMIGSHPDETLKDVDATISLIYELMPDFVALSLMCPYPGTEVYRTMVDKGYMSKNPDWSQFSVFGDLKRYERLTHMTRQQMWEMQYKFNRDYYLSGRYIFNQVRQIRSLDELNYFLRMAWLFLREFFKGTSKNHFFSLWIP